MQCWVMKYYKNRLCLVPVLMVVLMIVQPILVSAAVPESWKTEWEQTPSAAKKEGEITFYGSQGYEKVFEVFQKRYPEIKFNAVTKIRGS